MKMIQSGQGLPASFQLPQQLRDLGQKLQGAAKAQKGAGSAAGTGGYDYEYYYVDDGGKEIPSTGSSLSAPRAPASSSLYSPSAASAASAAPATPAAPLFPAPNPSFVAGGGSLFDFLENDDEPTPSSSATAAAPTPGKSLSDRLTAAQNRAITG